MTWREEAACLWVDRTIFFPGPGEIPRAAMAVCAGCPVKTECLEAALSHSSRHDIGIWGGVTQRERDRLRGLRRGGGE